MTNWQRIIAVARRELRIIRQRPIYLLGSPVAIGAALHPVVSLPDRFLPAERRIGRPVGVE